MDPEIIDNVGLVAEIISNSRSVSLLIDKWREFSWNLGMDEVELLKLERMQNTSLIEPKEVPREILSLWKAKKGTNATLKELCDALDNCGVRDVAEQLLSELFTLEDVKLVRLKWQEKEVTLEDLLGMKTTQDFYVTLYNEMKQHWNPNPHKSVQKILKEELMAPPLPKYYIHRTLSYTDSMELDDSIFNSELTKEHVFLFKDMSKNDLARLTEYKMEIDESWNQRHKLSVRFILLVCDKDYDTICQNNKNKPIHLIQCRKRRYFWIKSSQCMETVQKFLHEEKKHVKEEKLVSRITSLPSPCSISISDSPGMGKTLLLAYLAVNITDTDKDSLVLFIVLQELAEHINSPSTSAIDTIVKYSSCDEVAELILAEKLQQKTQPIYLLLDGYDEVMENKLDQVDMFLKGLQELNNVKVIVTTRPHPRTRLETVLNQFSYEILPFSESNKMEFLTRYWVNHDSHKAKESASLVEFAKQCLTASAVKLSDKDKKITGIPLQCMLLAEVYAEDAESISALETLSESSVVHSITSITLFEMYRRLIELKLNKIPKDSAQSNMWTSLCNWFGASTTEQKYLDAHVHAAILLLFSNWIPHFQRFLNSGEKLEESTLYSIGLLEKGPNTSRFIHRTFAEYLLAEFIVTNLGRYGACVDLLFEEILGRKGTIDEAESIYNRFYKHYYVLKHPVLAYFIEMHLKAYIEQHTIDELTLPDRSKPSNILDEDIYAAIGACSSNDLECTFDYVAKLFHQFKINHDNLRDDYIKDLPHLVADRSNEFTMLEKVLRFTNLEFGVGLSYHTVENKTFNGYLGSLNIPKYTPLHVAVHKGKYNMATYLVRQYQDEINSLKCLLHTCVHESAENNASVINDKQLIIEMLVGINHDFLEERDSALCTPLLQQNVHLTLLKSLFRHGANINAHSQNVGTVLHASRDKQTYKDLVHWALTNGFTQINSCDRDKRTPLMHAIRKFKILNKDVLKMFKDAGASFNGKDADGNSVLFHAHEISGSADFIKKLLECGCVADAADRNNRKQNALHKVVKGTELIENRVLLVDMLVGINREWLKERDEYDCTPLLQWNVDLRLLQRLVQHGSDINEYSSSWGTILHRAKNPKTFADIIRWALSKGFKRTNHYDCHQRTEIMCAIMDVGIVKGDALELFKSAGADFNAEDRHGNSVLFYALRCSWSEDFIKELVYYGANVNHRNKDNENVKHIAMNPYNKLDPGKRVSVLRFLESRGFHNA